MCIRIGHNQKQGCFPVSDLIQFHFIVRHDLTKLCDFKWGKSGTTGNQNRLRRFASRHFVFFILSDRKVLRIPFFQFPEHHIHRVLVSFILFTGFTFIQKIQKSIQILLLFITLIPDEGNQCCVQQFLRL